ncbi:MAG: hypothetical protein KGJ62_07970 [Armatimonadetes bacterium]|nr:hypothetical protein [Armatimonadota bacterium]MDE2205212.1 hypothetical protein [Armatimonadota bacterium]
MSPAVNHATAVSRPSVHAQLEPSLVETNSHTQAMWAQRRSEGLHRDRLGKIAIVVVAVVAGAFVRMNGSAIARSQTQRGIQLRRQLLVAGFQLANLQARQAHILSPAGVAQLAVDHGMAPADPAASVRIGR